MLKRKRVQERAKLVKVASVGPSLYWLGLKAPRLLTETFPQPGQFLHVLAGPGCDPLLRRPLSVLDADRDASEVELYLQLVGRGSRFLASLSPGEEIDVLGPLGRGFRAVGPDKTLYLVAGGVGLAPLFFLARAIAQGRTPEAPRKVLFLLGARSRADMPAKTLLDRLPSAPLLASDDGSAGHRGTVIGLLEALLAREEGEAELAGCGPPRMLAALAGLASRECLPCQVSLEQVMGCGVGACQGCVVASRLAGRESGAGEGYSRVCTEGPVFEAGEVDWQSLLDSAPHAGGTRSAISRNAGTAGGGA